MAAALTLREVSASNAKAVINSTQWLHHCFLDVLNRIPVRQKDIYLTLAFPSKSIEKSRHCARTLSRWDYHLVYPGNL
jgi:hypothetical protein